MIPEIRRRRSEVRGEALKRLSQFSNHGFPKPVELLIALSAVNAWGVWVLNIERWTLDVEMPAAPSCHAEACVGGSLGEGGTSDI